MMRFTNWRMAVISAAPRTADRPPVMKAAPIDRPTEPAMTASSASAFVFIPKMMSATT